MTLKRYVDAYRYRRTVLSHPNAGNIRRVKQRANALWELRTNTSHRVYNDWVSGYLIDGVTCTGCHRAYTRDIPWLHRDGGPFETPLYIKRLKPCAVPGKTIRSTTDGDSRGKRSEYGS
jgi:hypothetical protein